MNQKLIIGAVILAGVAFSLGRFTGPKEVELKEVQKVVYVEKEKTEKDQTVSETEKETRLPDGTIIREKTKTKETQTKTKSSSKGSETKRVESKVDSRPSWRVGIGYQSSFEDIRKVHYSLIIEKRLVGELYLGTNISTEKSVSLTLTIGF